MIFKCHTFVRPTEQVNHNHDIVMHRILSLCKLSLRLSLRSDKLRLEGSSTSGAGEPDCESRVYQNRKLSRQSYDKIFITMFITLLLMLFLIVWFSMYLRGKYLIVDVSDVFYNKFREKVLTLFSLNKRVVQCDKSFCDVVLDTVCIINMGA